MKKVLRIAIWVVIVSYSMMLPALALYEAYLGGKALIEYGQREQMISIQWKQAQINLAVRQMDLSAAPSQGSNVQ